MFGVPARRSTWSAARLTRGYALPAVRAEPEAGQHDTDPSSPLAEAGPSKPRGPTQANRSPGEKSLNSSIATEGDEGQVKQPGKRGRKARTSAQRAAFVNARAFALAMKQSKADTSATPASSIPSGSDNAPSTSSTVPQASTSASEEPKLLDLLAKKPDRPPPSFLSKRYPNRYARLVDSIEQAFVKSQLIAFSRELGIHANDTTAKQKIIARIVASWGWPSPEEHAVEREMRNRAVSASRREVISHDIPDLTAVDIHLFLSDPALVDQMIRRNNLKISVLRDTDVATNVVAHERLAVPGQTAPTASSTADAQKSRTAGEERVILRVNGANSAIKHLEEFMAVRRASKHYIDVPLSDLLGYMPSPVLLSAVSRATLTFLEPVGGESIRISGLRQDDMKRAEGLLLRSAIRRLPTSQPDQSLLVTHASTHPKPLPSPATSSPSPSGPDSPSPASPTSSIPPTTSNISTLADSLLSPSSPSSPLASSPEITPIEHTYTLLPFTPPSNYPLPWHAAAEMQSAHVHPVRLSQGRVWQGYNTGRVLGHEKEFLRWGSVRVLKARGGTREAAREAGQDITAVEDQGGDGTAGDMQGARRLSEALRVQNVSEAEENDIVNTLSFGHAIYSSHLGPLDTLLTSTPLEELPEYIKDMSMPAFCPSSPPRMIQNALDGPSTTTRHLRYRLLSSSTSPSGHSPIDEVFEFTYTLPAPPNTELDAARLDAELGMSNMADPANGGLIRDAVSPKAPSDWVSMLEAQLDADMRRQEAERAEREIERAEQEEQRDDVGEGVEAGKSGTGDRDVVLAEGEGMAHRVEGEEVDDLSAEAGVEAAGQSELDQSSFSPREHDLPAVTRQSSDTPEQPQSQLSVQASPSKSTLSPLPPLEITSTISTPYTSLLHFPNRANDILHTAAHSTPIAVPSPIRQFFQHIHEALHRSSFRPSPSSTSSAPGEAIDDLSQEVHGLDDALFGQPGPDREYATFEPPPRFTVTFKTGGKGQEGGVMVKTYGLESDEERTTVGYEMDGVEVKWVQRKEMGVPWAQAVGCTEMVYKGSQPPESLWAQLNRISMDAPPNAIKSARGEVYN